MAAVNEITGQKATNASRQVVHHFGNRQSEGRGGNMVGPA